MKVRILPVIAIAAALAAVVVAFLAWRRLGAAPAAPAVADRAEVWGPAWKALRGCVLGPAPASTDVTEAIAAADLVTPDRTCGRELVAVARAAGDGDDWTKVRRAIGELAEALGKHQQRRQALPAIDVDDDNASPDRLPGSVTEVEAAVARIVDVGPPPAVKVLPRLTAAPIVVDGQIASQVSIWRNAMHVSTADSGIQRLLHFAGGQPVVLPQADAWADSVWSPRSTWQVYVDSGGTGRKTAIKAAAADLGWTQVVGSGPRNSLAVWAAIGEDALRMVVVTVDYKTFLVRSTDAGAHWTRTAIPVGNGYLATAVSTAGDRLDIAWTDDGTHRLGIDLAAHATGPLPESTVLSPAQTWMQCNTGALWLVLIEADDQYVVRRADAATASGRFKTQPYVWSCSADKLALQSDDGDFVCDAETCAPLPALAVKPFAVVVGNEILRYQTWDGVIALWWGDRPPVFATMPGNRTISGVVDDAGTAIAILSTATRVEYAALPR